MQIFKNTIVDLSRSPASAGKLQAAVKNKRREMRLRGLGLTFVALAVAIMTWGNVNSSSTVVTASPANDVIVGGVATDVDGLSGPEREAKIKQNTIDALNSVTFTGDIYRYYNITADDIENAELTTINTGNSALHSVGRQYFGEVTSENESGETKFFERTIKSAYRNKEIEVEALVGTRTDTGEDGYNRYFAIILSCGNPVLSYDEELKPQVEINKTADPAAGTAVEPGEEITYSIAYRNTGAAPAEGFSVADVLSDQLSLVGADSDGVATDQNGRQTITWNNPNGSQLEISESWSRVKVTVSIREDAVDGTEICNTAVASAVEDVSVPSETICHTVVRPVVTQPVCKGLTATVSFDKSIVLTATGSAGNNGEKLIITNGDDIISEQSINSDQPFNVRHEVSGDIGEYQFTAKIVSGDGAETTSESCTTSVKVIADCDHESRKDDESCPKEVLSYYKTGQNLTHPDRPKSSPDSDEPIPARSGDKIQYEIVYENLGNTTIRDITPQPDDVSDLEEYADIIETGGGALNRFNGRSEINWDDVQFTLEPGDRKVIIFMIQILDNGDDCNTPTPTNDGGQPNVRSFDCILENKYGATTVYAELEPGVSKQVQGVVTTIPNTGTTLMTSLSIAVLAVAAFSFYRTRLIAKELSIAKEIHRGQR